MKQGNINDQGVIPGMQDWFANRRQINEIHSK
jgi:hypothetical protein